MVEKVIVSLLAERKYICARVAVKVNCAVKAPETDVDALSFPEGDKIWSVAVVVFVPSTLTM
jgi:hypothetical protein